MLRRQIAMPLRWFEALAEQEFGPLERRCRRRAGHSTLITFDGPLTGGGATLQAGITQFNTAHRQSYVAFWAGEWTDDELGRINVARGDPAGQARLEALTLLHSVHVWRRIIRESTGTLAVMGDALGVLHDARKFRAKDPVLNELMAELALLIAPMGQELQAIHIWTQRNETCDALSRLGQKGGIPSCLENVRRCKKPVLKFRVLKV